jgi:hypothetical protein
MNGKMWEEAVQETCFEVLLQLCAMTDNKNINLDRRGEC